MFQRSFFVYFFPCTLSKKILFSYIQIKDILEELYMEKKDLRNILVELRGATGWSQKSFAEYFYIPRRTLQEWEL